MSDKKTQARRLSRREFGGIVAAGTALPVLAGAQNALPASPVRQADGLAAPNRRLVPEALPFDANLAFALNPVPLATEPFPMASVRLLPNSVFYDAQEWNRAYMLRLDADRMLYTFRANAGLPTKDAKPLGGWEQPENGQRASELRGHFPGHFLSASALLWASTGDKAAKDKGDYMVAEMAKCQEKLGGGYLSAFPTTWWDRLDRRERVWAPFYTIHKLTAGMWDMYKLAGNQQALKVLEGMAEWADGYTSRKSDENMQAILNIEFGGIAESFYHLAAETKVARWGKLADRFQKRSFINPLGLRRDELRGLHVNTHIPQVIAAARRYEVSGDLRFHDVADFFFQQVTQARSYVHGGTSNAESWLATPQRLAAELKMSTNTAECCCAYNMMRLARYLYSWRPDPAYFDYYDRVLLNHRIGTIRPKIGTTQYYLSLTPGVWKTFNTDDQTFWCCTGTGVEEYAKLNDSIYWRDRDGLLVNLFVPSELDWADKGFKLRQETTYPTGQSTALTVVAAKPSPMAIRIRIPSWLNAAPTVKLNGRPLEASAAPGSYFAVNRVWKAGDRLELDLPMHLHMEAMPDDPTQQAFMYGPLVLAGDLGGDGLTEAHICGPNLRVGAPGVEQNGSPLSVVNQTPPIAPVEIPTFKAAGPDPNSWIKPTDKPGVFKTVGQAKDVTLVPFNSLFDKRYSVYWQVT